MSLANMDEFGLIQHLTERLQTKRDDVVVGIGDDAAVVRTPAGEQTVVTIDTMVQGVHFAPDTMEFADVGYKCVAASISDVAAMGGVPKHVLISIAIPAAANLADLEACYDGIDDACRAYECAVIGGDVVRTDGPMVLTSTVMGTVPAGEARLRSGARPGDVVFVTGPVGTSAAGLRVLQKRVPVPPDEAAALIKGHQRPTPQVSAGIILRECRVSSCNDVSDGLASELNEIAKASKVRLRIDSGRIPMHPAARNLGRRLGEDPLDYAWYGGEDYQLVGTASPLSFAQALSRCQSIGVTLAQIGRVEPGDGVVADKDGQLSIIEPRGFNHFR